MVIDPAINPEKMEMYADVEARGGILEPPGIVEVKYRAPQQVEAMHRIDGKLLDMDAKLKGAQGEAKQALEKDIKAREKQLPGRREGFFKELRPRRAQIRHDLA